MRLYDSVAEATPGHDAENRPEVVPEDGVQPRPLLEEGTRIEERILQMRRHPVLEPDVDVNHHRQPQRDAKRRRLRKDCRVRLADARLRGGFAVRVSVRRFRVAQEEREHNRPRKPDAAENPEGRAPALPALSGEKARESAAPDDAEIKPELEN